ncbi:MAG: YkuS family protein [Bacillaceae bacterium]|nr:YkuS family protein [Bacillaceae bacterium]
MPRVAVEDNLDQVENILRNNGYDVVRLGNQQQQVDAVVISGQDRNMMGMQDRQTGASVINAEGMTAEEVYEAVNRAVPNQQNQR